MPYSFAITIQENVFYHVCIKMIHKLDIGSVVWWLVFISSNKVA